MRRNAVIRATLVVLFVLFLNFSNAVGQEKHYRYKYLATEYQLVDGKFGNKEYKVQNSRFSSYIVLSFSTDRKNAWLTSSKKELAFYDGKKHSDNIYEYFDNGFDQYGGLYDYMENATDEAHTTMLVSPKYSRVHILYLEPTPGNKKKFHTRCDIYEYENKASVSPEVQRERYRKRYEHYKRIADLEASAKKAEEEKRKARKFVYNDKSVYTDENGKVVDSSIFKRGCKTLVVTHAPYCRPSNLLLKYVKNIDCDVIVITFEEKQPKRHILPNATNIYLKDHSTWHFDNLIPCYLLVDGNGEVLEWHTGFNSKDTSKIDKMVAAIQDDKLYSQRVPKNEIWYLSNNGKISVRDNFSAKCLSHTYINGKGVIKFDKELTKIGYRAFANSAHLTKIVIPDGVTEIGKSAFRDCTSLTSVTIPNRVTSIGSYAFAGCSSMTSITIPDSVTSIVDYAFDGCTSLTSVTIGNSVTSIGCCAFHGCTSLTSVTIPDSVTSIGYDAFNKCTSLTSVTIGNSVTSIGSYAFRDCTSLTSVTIPNRVTSIGSYAFAGCSSMTSITIPDSVTSIGSCAFDGCTSLTSVTIPDSVTSIGYDAFNKCTSLTSVTIGNSVTSIGSYAFHSCTRLTSITIPNSVTSIGRLAFAGCSSMTSITISDSVTSIGNNAFAASGIRELVLPQGLTSVPVEVCYNCRQLTSVTIGNSVTSIGTNAFRDCSSLKSITIPNSVTSIGSLAFGGCSSMRSVTIPDSVTSIGNNAFAASGIRELVLPQGLTSVPVEVCYNCGSLESVTIPNRVTSIGSNAFCNCYSLKSITIPNSVTSIGEKAFSCCYALKIVIPNSVTSIGKEALENCSGKLTIDNKMVEIDHTPETKPIKDGWLNKTSFREIEFGDNVKKIGAYTFHHYPAIKKVTLSKSVEVIGEGALSGTSIDEIVIPEGVVSIEKDAFNGCTKLYRVIFEGATPPQLGAGVFQSCGPECVIYVPAANMKAYKKNWKNILGKYPKLKKYKK